MKKSLALFLVLAIFAISGTCYVNATLLEEKDNVQITETVVYGDESVVEGVTIERNIKYDNYIRWNTTYVVGEEPSCETAYTFDANGRLREDGNYVSSGIELYTNPIGNFDDEEQALELIGLDKAMKELLDETAPGEEKSVVVNLADYLDYYVYEVHLDFPDVHYYFMNESDIKENLEEENLSEYTKEELEKELHIVQTMTDFFKIPVIENHIYEISVSKDMDGKLYGWGYGSASGGGSSGGVTLDANLDSADSFDLWMMCTYTEDMCYFTFNNRTRNNEIVDTSHIPGGYGIYCLPFDSESGIVDVDNLKMVYLIDPSAYVMTLQLDEKRENLLLFTEEKEGCVMTVIDLQTMQTKQQLIYSDSYESYGCYIYDEFVVLEYAWDKAIVLSIKEDGTYQVEMHVDMEPLMECGMKNVSMQEMIFDWNGETLAISGSLYDERGGYYEHCGFYLAAIDATGLRYYGEYESSLDTGREYDDYYYNCMPTDTEGLKISW